MCLPYGVNSTLWQIKAMPGTSFKKKSLRQCIRAQDCEFKEKDNMIRDRIVFECSSTRVREKLINEGAKLTIDKAVSGPKL